MQVTLSHSRDLEIVIQLFTLFNFTFIVIFTIHSLIALQVMTIAGYDQWPQVGRLITRRLPVYWGLFFSLFLSILSITYCCGINGMELYELLAPKLQLTVWH